ncbi:MAG: hypothetical protein KBD26_02970 [Candidatus Pacebacteria bacterium]|nr:hypothetical protein [Candidatus Paceibacterota bacterium]MBP9772772.1 hypothetical protein [Candidatus Paceibacterota bacterium]QQR76667.1 MAG: hypothetical protein IPJ63_00120 [Candidatus Nomurabacteria bacterium]
MKEILEDNGLYGVTYFFMTLVVAGIAQGKNRTSFAWWLASLILTPPIVLFILVVFVEKRKVE